MTMTICAISHAISQTSTERLDALFAVLRKDAALLQALLLHALQRSDDYYFRVRSCCYYIRVISIESGRLVGAWTDGGMEGKISGRTAAVALPAGKCATGSTLHHVMQQ